MDLPQFVLDRFDSRDKVVRKGNYIFETGVIDIESREQQRKILIVTGLSGAGKDTLVNKLIEDSDVFVRVKTNTTRLRRPEESETADTYNRLTEDAFKHEISAGRMLEYVEYSGNLYGTSIQSISDALNIQNKIPVLRIDPAGCQNITEMWRKGRAEFAGVKLISVFVVPESLEELRQRLVDRGDTPTQVQNRMAQTEKDLSRCKYSQLLALNQRGKVDEVVHELEGILLG